MQLPPELLSSLENVKGFDVNTFTLAHQPENRVVSVRYHPLKSAAIEKKGEGVPWSTEGYYLDERPSFTLDPLFHAGAYYVQEASSMFLEQALKQSCDITLALNVLDLCAAPGGKSTLIQSLISEESLLVSNEIIKTRVNVLLENITKFGAANVVVTNNDARDFQKLPGFFDVVVVDAPCSGSGLFKKNTEAINEWSLQNVELCSQRQQRILADVIPALKPGGIIIYSTCSYSLSENESIVDWLMEHQQFNTVRLQIKGEWNIIETESAQHNGYGYRFYPDKVKGEGFFIAVLKKADDAIAPKELKANARQQQISNKEIDLIKSYVKNPGNFSFMQWQKEILAIPTAIYRQVLMLQSALYIKKAGVTLGSLIRNELIPAHDWAISTILSDKVLRISVEKEEALEYLRKQEINLTIAAKGWAIIVYKEIPLGLIKILSGRVNNYYPKEWRILNK
ncbi:MAG: methyltransferase domain-containing protein [Bacteroidetes bacterium]|nr:methyltransferase domain-containing protein [Bacteroidota bacterium]MBS1756885.1 methyltransferase domain-containing protein [Bacteroidota bacterium]